jgi:ABC-type spermidine/putrescine transport system permease subunit I
MQLLLSSPLWIALIITTIAVHVGFFVALRRMQKRDAARQRSQQRPH